jgi:hypothetical protein
MDEDKAKVEGYRDLIVWQKSIALVKQIYQLTQNFPNDEKFGLVSQMRRAAVSIPSNIAEGKRVEQQATMFILFLLPKALWLSWTPN